MTLPIKSFVGRDNVTRISLYSDETLLNMDEWTRVVLVIKDGTGATIDTLDTNVGGDPISKSSNGIDAQFGKISPPLTAAVYVVKVDIYNAAYTNGIRWTEDIELTMVAV